MKDVINPIDTDSGLFQDGDPATGAEGTIVSAKWLNDMQAAEISTQKEIISILTEAGLKPDAAATNQLLTAIKAVLTTGLKGALLSANNLSDLKDIEDARKNLELGKLALKDSLSAGDVGALSTAGGSLTGVMKTNSEIQSTSQDNFRIVAGNYGIYWRQDGNSLYLMLTNAGDQYGRYNDFRPIRVDLASGDVYINENKPYSNANKPSTGDIGAIRGDACNQAGFVSQNSQDPYMMYGSNTIVQLAARNWVNEQISVVQNWASNDLRNDIYNWCRQNFVAAVRLGSERVQASTNDSGGVISLGGGEVFTGAAGVGGSDFNKAQWRVRQLQYLLGNGQWVAAGSI